MSAGASPPLLITRLQRVIDDTLRPLLADAGPVALVGFPNYTNVGDSAIWLGTLGCLAGSGGAPPRYVCDAANYSRQRLAQCIGRGTILVQGGGNLGDLWEAHQRFRETVIDAFPDNPIIQLPQSIWFRDRTALARARQVFNRHPNLTLLLRESQSLAIARNEFRARSVLCPDLALCLGPLPRPTATRPVVWLARSDQEAAVASQPPADAAIAPVDWLTEHAPPLVLARWLGRRGWLPSSSYEWLARQRLRRGTRLLSAGRVVITDRLHGHILCVLLGIPHVVLDNSYGKLRSFYETWTSEYALARWCDSAGDAMRSVGDGF